MTIPPGLLEKIAQLTAEGEEVEREVARVRERVAALCAKSEAMGSELMAAVPEARTLLQPALDLLQAAYKRMMEKLS